MITEDNEVTLKLLNLIEQGLINTCNQRISDKEYKAGEIKQGTLSGIIRNIINSLS